MEIGYNGFEITYYDTPSLMKRIFVKCVEKLKYKVEKLNIQNIPLKYILWKKTNMMSDERTRIWK